MKRLSIVLATILLTLSAWAGPARGDTLRILAIGNSFSQDAIEQNLWELFHQEGKVVVVGNLYIGGCTLQRHFFNARNDTTDYLYRKVVDGVRTEYPHYTLERGLADESWDVVSLQQASGVSGMFETFQPYLLELVRFVKARTRDDVRLVWHQTWAYSADAPHPEFPNYGRDQLRMYKAILAAGKRAMRESGIRTVIPSGTAIQNARGTFLGDRMNRDGYHLELTYGRYTAACTWYEALTGRDVRQNAWHPASITSETAAACRAAAHASCRKPYRVTPLPAFKQQ